MKRARPAVFVLPLVAGALASCATTRSAEGDGGDQIVPAICDETTAAQFIGQRATAELGARLLQITGARNLRWAPPNSAMTMDFRPDRLTVSYDQAYAIDRINCG